MIVSILGIIATVIFMVGGTIIIGYGLISLIVEVIVWLNK